MTTENTSRPRLKVPRQFREHHDTAIASYRGRSMGWYDTIFCNCPRGGDIPLWAHCHNQGRDLQGRELDCVLLLPPGYPPHTPVMDEVIGDPEATEAGWQEFYKIYRYALPPEERPGYSAHGLADDNYPQFMTMDELMRKFEVKYGDPAPKVNPPMRSKIKVNPESIFRPTKKGATL